ncbi:MAG: Fe-S cluster assembly protein SufD [Rhodoblastus sp.]
MNKPILQRSRTEAETALIDRFDQGDRRLVGASELRAEAMRRFAETGLPTRRVESWHYTDLRGAIRTAALVRAPETATLPMARECLTKRIAQTQAHRFVIFNGVYNEELSSDAPLPEGVTATTLSAALAAGDQTVLDALKDAGPGEGDAVVALNTALMEDGVVIRVAPGVKVDRPLAILNLMCGGFAQATFLRSVLIVGAGASVSLDETSAVCAPDATQANEGLTVVVGDSARVDYAAQVTEQGPQSVALHSLFVTMGANAAFNGFCLVPQAGLVRRQIFARLDGEHSTLSLGGLSLLRGKEHADTTLVVDHAVPNCVSREFFRYILDHESTGVFQGKVVVRQHAQKTDGGMKSQALVLGEDASMNNKPELEIFADDVVCGHGATVGQLDPNQIFYLRARGLPRGEAESLLLEAFANEALDLVADESVRARYATQTADWLAHRSGR